MEESRALKIIKSLISLVGVTAGIILVSVGGVMFLNSLFNLYVFKLQDEYRDDYKCQIYDLDAIEAQKLLGYDNPRPIPLSVGVAPTSSEIKKEKIVNLTEEQKEKLKRKYRECKKEAEAESQRRYELGQKRSFATGLSFLLVGLPLIFFYQGRRRRKSEKEEGR